MSLEKITAQLANESKMNNAAGAKVANKNRLPPVELWDPPYCGELDIEIKANGDWFSGGTIFKRMSLVKLLASVLKKEADDYFLVTPVEKVKIHVEDAPFVLTQWHWQDEKETIMEVSTNLGDEFVVDNEHEITINDAGELYISVRRNLVAKVHRNVYYQWIDIAKEVDADKGKQFIITSAGVKFCVGVIPE